jgi:hypothetical protein
MADPILHSVVEPPKAQEITATSKSVNPRVVELLQSIYSISKTAATSISLSKAVDSAGDLQNYVDPNELREFGLEAGYDAVNKLCTEAEELARLLDIDLRSPTRYKLSPVFSGE